jgi:FtsH-binding integral membrane protein
MIIPILVFALGFLAVLGYFTRERITYTPDSPQGGYGMALIVFIIFAIVGYFLDSATNLSLTFQYMYSVGGALQAIAIVFWAAFIMLMLSMLWSAQKCGKMVS